jgi:hypothetical protein
LKHYGGWAKFGFISRRFVIAPFIAPVIAPNLNYFSDASQSVAIFFAPDFGGIKVFGGIWA